MLRIHKVIADAAMEKKNVQVLTYPGMSYELVLGELVRRLKRSDKLIFVLGSRNTFEESFFQMINPDFQSINSKTFTLKERVEIYRNRGGPFFITERILVSDLLLDKVPLERVGGFFIIHSELLSSKLNYVTFVLDVFFRMFIEQSMERANNMDENDIDSQLPIPSSQNLKVPEDVFIKVFSNKVSPFRNFGSMKDIMNNTYTDNIRIFPRFHHEAKQTLRNECQIEEVQVLMGSRQEKIHQNLSKLLRDTLSHLYSLNKSMEHALNYERFLYGHPPQHPPNELKAKSKRFYREAIDLRYLLLSCIGYDAVHFYIELESLLDDLAERFSSPTASHLALPNWAMTDQGMEVVSLAKARVFQITKSPFPAPPSKRQRTLTQMNREQEPLPSSNQNKSDPKNLAGNYQVNWELESDTKVKSLREVLEEIRERMLKLPHKILAANSPTKTCPVVLILARNKKKVSFLRRMLSMGEKEYLLNSAHRMVRIRVRRQRDGGNPLRFGFRKYYNLKSSKKQPQKLKQQKLGNNNQMRKKPNVSHRKRSMAIVEEEHEMEVLIKYFEKSKEVKRKEAKMNYVRQQQNVFNFPRNQNQSSLKKKKKKKQKKTGFFHDDLESEFENCFRQIDPSPKHPSEYKSKNQQNTSQYDIDDQYLQSLSDSIILIHPIYQITKLLEQYKPIFIVIYDLESNETIHSIEEYYSRYFPNIPVQVYILMYKDSYEEPRFQWRLKYDSICWQSVIRNRQRIVLPPIRESIIHRYYSTPKMIEKRKKEEEEEEDELMDTRRNQVLGLDPKKKRRRRRKDNNPFMKSSNRRKKKKKNTKNIKSVIIVDSREFRSSLPISLHQFGFSILPATLQVGDYLLSPNLCIERKSPGDLVSSLNHGRLLSQAQRMSRKYSKSALLIEFEDNRTQCSLFRWQELRNQKLTQGHVSVKLYILIRSYPDLRILWSRGSEETAQLFKCLKDDEIMNDDLLLAQHEEEMEEEMDDEELLVRFGALNTGNMNMLTSSQQNMNEEEEYRDMAIDMLRKLPGINDQNYRKVMENVESLEKLCRMSKAELQRLLGNKSGEILYSFLIKGEK